MGTIDLNALPIFAAVAESASFTRAAARLGMPKSSVSRAVASLEAELGVPLFHRTTRSVALSTAGLAFWQRVSPSLSALQRSVSDLPERAEAPSGKLRITAAPDFGASVLAELVTRFVARHPEVTVEVELSNAYVDLVSAGFDLALRISRKPLASSQLVARKLGPVALQLYASPQYLALHGAPRTAQELSEHTSLFFRERGPLRLEGPGKPVTVERRGAIVCDDMFFAREALRQGAGIGVLPRFLGDELVASGELACVLPRYSVLGGQLWIVHPGARQVPRKVLAFRDFTLEVLRARPFDAT